MSAGGWGGVVWCEGSCKWWVQWWVLGSLMVWVQGVVLSASSNRPWCSRSKPMLCFQVWNYPQPCVCRPCKPSHACHSPSPLCLSQHTSTPHDSSKPLSNSLPPPNHLPLPHHRRPPGGGVGPGPREGPRGGGRPGTPRQRRPPGGPPRTAAVCARGADRHQGGALARPNPGAHCHHGRGWI